MTDLAPLPTRRELRLAQQRAAEEAPAPRRDAPAADLRNEQATDSTLPTPDERPAAPARPLTRRELRAAAEAAARAAGAADERAAEAPEESDAAAEPASPVAPAAPIAAVPAVPAAPTAPEAPATPAAPSAGPAAVPTQGGPAARPTGESGAVTEPSATELSVRTTGAPGRSALPDLRDVAALRTAGAAGVVGVVRVTHGFVLATCRGAARVVGDTSPLQSLVVRPVADVVGRVVATHGAPFRALVVRPTAIAVVAVSFLAGGVTQVQVEHTHRQHQWADAQAAAAAQAAQDEAERQARVARAETIRLTGQASAYVAHKRTEALDVARQALATAGTVVTAAAPVVPAEQISPLDQAVAELAALVESSPDPVAVSADIAALDEVTDAVVPPADQLASASAMASPEGLDLVDGAASRAAARDAAPVEAPEATTRRGTASSTPVVPLPIEALDLGRSAELVAAAEMVASLSAQVQAAADEAIAAQRAAEAAAAAAEAARLENARKVQLAEDAPNGAIPSEALCGVSFSADALLRCDAAAALEELNKAYRSHFGRNLVVSSSYRDYASQVATKRSRGSLAATPGTSNHGRGLAVDFGDFGSVGEFGTPNYLWMKANGPRFGWHHPDIMEPGGGGPQEPWHWEYGTQ